ALLGGSWSWKAQLALFLIPTAIYGLMFLGQHMPKSEASVKGLSLGEMMKDVGLLGGVVVCLLVALFVKEALGGMLALLLKNDFFTGPTWGYLSWGVGLMLWLAVGGLTRGSIGAWLLFVLRSEEHTSELQSRFDVVCRLLLEKKKPPTISCPSSLDVSRATPTRTSHQYTPLP